MPQEPSEIALGTRVRFEKHDRHRLLTHCSSGFFVVIVRVPALITMTVGMLVFASLISNINTVINDGSLIKFEEKMEALDEFFKHRNLPTSLLERVRQYHEKIFDMSHGACNELRYHTHAMRLLAHHSHCP